MTRLTKWTASKESGKRNRLAALAPNVPPPFTKSRSDKSHWKLNTEAFNLFDRKIGLYLIKSQNNRNNL